MQQTPEAVGMEDVDLLMAKRRVSGFKKRFGTPRVGRGEGGRCAASWVYHGRHRLTCVWVVKRLTEHGRDQRIHGDLTLLVLSTT